MKRDPLISHRVTTEPLRMMRRCARGYSRPVLVLAAHGEHAMVKEFEQVYVCLVAELKKAGWPLEL